MHTKARLVGIATHLALLTACKAVDVELLAPRGDVGKPEPASSADDGGDQAEDAAIGEGPAVYDGGEATRDASLPEDAGSSSCPPYALLCGGFEENLAGWTFVRSDGTATATTLDSHSGVGALELTTRATGAFAFLEHALLPVSDGALHVRAFVKLPADQTLESFDLVALTNATSDGGVTVSYREPSLSISGGTSSAPGTLAFPRDVWVCVELALSLSAESSASIDVNGARDATLLFDQGVPSGGYTRVRLGIVSSSATQSPTRILLDDLMVATSPIGCD